MKRRVTINLDKEQLRTGDMLICTADRLLSEAIKGMTDSKVSHTAHVIRSHGEILIVEAQRKGVHIITYDEWIRRYNYNYMTVRPLILESRRAFAQDAYSKQSHKNYDIKAILWDFPIYILTGKWLGEKTEEEALIDNKFNCSTLSGYLYKFLNWWKMSPQDIYEEVDSRPNDFVFM